MDRTIRTGVIAGILLIASVRAGRACADETWQPVAARPLAAVKVREPAILKAIAAAGWRLKSARGALSPVQLAHNEDLEFQDFTQYAFTGGALRLCVSRGSGGGAIFALLVDTRSSHYRTMDALSGALQLVAEEQQRVSEFGISDAHTFWYTTADGQTNAVTVQHQ